MTFPVIPANPGPAHRTRLRQAGRGPGQAPKSRKDKHFWTPAGVYPERSRRAGVTPLMTFYRENPLVGAGFTPARAGAHKVRPYIFMRGGDRTGGHERLRVHHFSVPLLSLRSARSLR
jgi:hypothetical protein